MDQAIYRSYFHSISKNNNAIANTDSNERFFEIVRSFDPIELVWDKDFISSIRSKLKLNDGKCAMVLEAMETEWMDPGSNDRTIAPVGSFIILKKSNIQRAVAVPSEVSQCLADTMAVGEQIMAYIEKDCELKYHSGNALAALYINLNSVKMFPVGPLETNIFGTRVEFTWKTPKWKATTYDDQWWGTPLS